MITSCNEYRDYAYLKKLGSSYKLIKCNSVKRKGLESVDIVSEYDSYLSRTGTKLNLYNFERKLVNFSSENTINGKFNDIPNDDKLSNNITRARNKIFEYVLCNDFNFFVTLTLNPQKYDRNNLSLFNHDLNIFIRDYNKRKNANIKFLFIPETHVDGS